MTLANRALWRKTVSEALLLLVPLVLSLIAFTWLNVYITNRLEVQRIPEFVKLIVPTDMLQLNSMNINDWGTRKGLMSFMFVHPLVEAVFLAWALARGSAAVSGELGRGTMEMLLAQPISRRALLTANAATTVLGAAILAASTIFGLWLGLATAPVKPPKPPEPAQGGLLEIAAAAANAFRGAAAPPAEERISARDYLPAAAIVFAYCVATAAITTMVSAFTTYRYRTLGIMGIFGVVQVGMDVVWRWLGKDHSWLAPLKYFTLKASFEPQLAMFCDPDQRVAIVTQLLLVFAAVTVVAYALAFRAFARRDLPAPM